MLIAFARHATSRLTRLTTGNSCSKLISITPVTSIRWQHRQSHSGSNELNSERISCWSYPRGPLNYGHEDAKKILPGNEETLSGNHRKTLTTFFESIPTLTSLKLKAHQEDDLQVIVWVPWHFQYEFQLAVKLALMVTIIITERLISDTTRSFHRLWVPLKKKKWIANRNRTTGFRMSG